MKNLARKKLFIVGIGPGGLESLTQAAQKALEEAEVIIGYHRYLDQVRPLLQGKEIISAGMTEEIKRAQKALTLASEGRCVALVSGGDPGIYGMSAPVFELFLAQPRAYACEIVVVPGITAACAAAAKFGAPLSTDLAFISLSDRLTPWSTIEKRLKAACEGDFVLVLYNPTSKKRAPLLEKALELLLSYRPPQTPVGVAQGITRPGEKIWVTTLKELKTQIAAIDMRTTLIVGNSETKSFGKYLLTPRGYGLKYDLHHEKA